MSDMQPFDLQRIQCLAEQGDLNAIATWLNYHLNPRGITAKVGWKNHCLGILLESSPFPDQVEMVAFIRQNLAHLKPEPLQLIKVCGYQPGQSVPAWYEEIEIGDTSMSGFALEYSSPSLMSWLNQGLEPSLNNQGYFSTSDTPIEQHRFLRFYLTASDIALLPLNQIQEVAKIAVSEILPVPHMADCILGIYNWRGEMLWLVDVAQQLGFTSALMQTSNLRTVSAIVLQTDGKLIGIIVSHLLNVESHSIQQIQPPTAGLFPTRLLSFMQGYLLPSTSPILNVKALVNDPLLQVHCLV